jgi:hypothetical protein
MHKMTMRHAGISVVILDSIVIELFIHLLIPVHLGLVVTCDLALLLRLLVRAAIPR